MTYAYSKFVVPPLCLVLVAAVFAGCGGRTGGGASDGGVDTHIAVSDTRESEPTTSASAASSDVQYSQETSSAVPTHGASSEVETTSSSVVSGSETMAVETSSDVASSGGVGLMAPIDWLYPPNGGAPFDLPEEYGALDWFDVELVFSSTTHDETQCSTFYDDREGAFGLIECQAASDGWSCQCYDAPGDMAFIGVPTYFVETSENPGQACRLGAGVCRTKLPPVNRSCYDTGYRGGFSPRGCFIQERCVYNHTSPHGTLTKTALMPGIECREHVWYPYLSVSQYVCREEGSSLGVTGDVWAQPERSLSQTCGVGVRFFRDGVDDGSEGPGTCQSQIPTVSVYNGAERSCESRFQCFLPATVLGEPVVVMYPENTARCFVSGSEWNCQCDGDLTYTRRSGVDGVEACTKAAEGCTSRFFR